jgi:hypothetical protein
VYKKENPLSVGLGLIGRLTVAPEYSSVTFRNEAKKVLAVTLKETGTYYLQWSDSGKGDYTSSVDVKVTLLYQDRSTVVSSCSCVDSGYTTPVNLGELPAGTYYIELEPNQAGRNRDR